MGRVERVSWVETHVQVANVVAGHVEPVRGCLWSDEPSKHFVTDFVPFVCWNFEARGKILVGVSVVLHVAPSVSANVGVVPEFAPEPI